MAEEVQYADSATNKRKYDDQTPPPSSRRTTGFSAPISSHSPDSANALSSYNTVPPPVDDIQLAKQRAQEIAARLFNNAEAKRPRVENGASAFDSNDNAGQKPMFSNVAPSSMPVSYGYQGSSKRIDVPNGRVGVIIGKGGETIKYLQLQSGAKIQVTRDMDSDPNSPTRMVELVGTPDQIAKAEQLIHDVLSEAEAGGSGIVSRRLTGQQSDSEQFVMKIPNNKVGLIIGKGGETIKSMQGRSGARIQVIPLHLPPGDPSTERTLQIDGTSEQIEAAKQLVSEVTSENRPRNPAMTGGYSQQGYQARPPTSWAPPGAPMQQPGYGYVQPGTYPGPSPQYNTSQPPYPGYPPQPTSGGYATGWDQTTGAPNQQTSQGGGYDYYSQQAQQQQAPGGPSAPADNTSYGYSQPPASGYNAQGQGYAQDGYGGYTSTTPQPGYGQPQPNPIQGYDQQGYTSAPGYGNVTNPTSESHTPSYGGAPGDTSQVPPPVQSTAMGQQGYNTTQQPSPSPANYPPQGSTQPGYGVATSQPGYATQPPSGYGPSYAQKPPANQSAYGQPQQSPSAQGGYVQPGYTHSQPPPAQPDSGAQRAPPSGYATATAQPGYGAPPYGTAPVTQPGYGQPPYNNSSYGGGYSQPPAYTADGNGGGNARGTYDAAPTSQVVQPSGVTKASPKS
ncbi:far upstream element-binding protein 1-like [Camellia sinensis]|uniref:far upstream element-binding protein 1-like n=1 Tax=Camellia sinensis TaxID=4442 RepID=UPI0010368C10|nr:far upstream element-binding protein 1-like [Camellia sinensis]